MDFYRVLTSLNEYSGFNVCPLTLVMFIEERYRVALTVFYKCSGKTDHTLLYTFSVHILIQIIDRITGRDKLTIWKCF